MQVSRSPLPCYLSPRDSGGREGHGVGVRPPVRLFPHPRVQPRAGAGGTQAPWEFELGKDTPVSLHSSVPRTIPNSCHLLCCSLLL